MAIQITAFPECAIYRIYSTWYNTPAETIQTQPPPPLPSASKVALITWLPHITNRNLNKIQALAMETHKSVTIETFFTRTLHQQKSIGISQQENHNICRTLVQLKYIMN